MKPEKAMFIAIIVVVLAGASYILINGEPNPIQIYTYEIEIPEHQTATHVKIGVVHNSPGVKGDDFNLGRHKIPENRTIAYETDYQIKHMFVLITFYEKSGSGFKQIDQESFQLEF